MNKKRILLTIIMVGLIMTTSACGKKKSKANNGNNGTTTTTTVAAQIANSKSTVIADYEIDGLKISNASFISENGAAVFTAIVTNTTNQDMYVKSFNIILKDSEGNQIRSMLGYVGETIASNNNYIMTTNVFMDINTVASVEYTRNY